METKELEMILYEHYFINLQERELIENTILRNIIIENQEINMRLKDKLINKFLNFSFSSRFIEDEGNEEIEKKLENILKNIKNLTK